MKRDLVQRQKRPNIESDMACYRPCALSCALSCALRARGLITTFLYGGLCGRALGARGPQVQEALVAARTRVAELEAMLKIKHEQAAPDQVCGESWMLNFE